MRKQLQRANRLQAQWNNTAQSINDLRDKKGRENQINRQAHRKRARPELFLRDEDGSSSTNRNQNEHPQETSASLRHMKSGVVDCIEKPLTISRRSHSSNYLKQKSVMQLLKKKQHWCATPVGEL